MKVTSHSENLAQSVCKMRAGDRLWCGTCHDPHSTPAGSDRTSWYRTKCLGCHQTTSCRESEKKRRLAGDDCTACHMPTSATVDAEHVVYTDHSIRRRVVPKVEDVDYNFTLIPFAGARVDARDEGIAYAMVGQHARAFDILKRSVSLESSDAEALLYLADLYNRDIDSSHKRDRDRAIPLYERAIQLDPTQLTGSVSLGAIRMEQGQLDDAIRHWTDALRKNPALVLVRFNLARALVSTRRRAEAEQVLEGALKFNPAFQPAREALKVLRNGK
jgi:predicted CXXCH cytochrome family protein